MRTKFKNEFIQRIPEKEMDVDTKKAFVFVFEKVSLIKIIICSHVPNLNDSSRKSTFQKIVSKETNFHYRIVFFRSLILISLCQI